MSCSDTTVLAENNKHLRGTFSSSSIRFAWRANAMIMTIVLNVTEIYYRTIVIVKGESVLYVFT